MNSDNFMVIAGTAIAAVLMMMGGSFLIDSSLQSAKPDTVGYSLPFEGDEPGEDPVEDKVADASPAAEEKPAAATATADEDTSEASAVTETAEAEAGAAAQPSESPYVDKVVAALDSASAESGAKVFRKCKACHLVKEGAGHRAGPNLWNVIGRDKGAIDGYSFSAALANKGGAWTPEAMAAFMKAPKEYVEGTKMNFRGLKDPQDSADLIAYLKTLK